jgi:hypothetical protein
MKFRYGRTNLAMTCHHTQVVTVLMSALFHFQRTNFSRKTAIFEVGTGEGKSLIIAMLAIYFWRVHGKKVHVLVNNSKLGKRDADEYKDYYKVSGRDVSCFRSFTCACNHQFRLSIQVLTFCALLSLSAHCLVLSPPSYSSTSRSQTPVLEQTIWKVASTASPKLLVRK